MRLDSRLVEYYKEELDYVRGMAEEFAARYEKLAPRLGLDGYRRGAEVPDPYVERLLEGVSLLAARVHLRLDAEFPRFSQHLIEALYPQLLAPLPSVALVQFAPDTSNPNLASGALVPRDTALLYAPPPAETGFAAAKRNGSANSAVPFEHADVQFSTCRDVTLWPVTLSDVRYSASTVDLPVMKTGEAKRAKASLRFTLASTDGAPLSTLALDSLCIHFAGSDATAHSLYQLVHGASMGLVLKAPQGSKWLGRDAVRTVGFANEHAILPVPSRHGHAFRLLQEYFAFSRCLLFFELHGLAETIRQCSRSAIEIVVVFDRSDDALEARVGDQDLALHVVPAVNLFQKVPRPVVDVSVQRREFHVLPDIAFPEDYEIFDVTGIVGTESAGGKDRTFEPIYAMRFGETAVDKCYFTTRRQPSLGVRGAAAKGRKPDYVGTELFVSLVDAATAPLSEQLDRIRVAVRCTNRNLPRALAYGLGTTDFVAKAKAIPATSIRVLGRPTETYGLAWKDGWEWDFLNALTLNFASLFDDSSVDGAGTFSDVLRLFATSVGASHQQIDAIRRVEVAPSVRRAPVSTDKAAGRDRHRIAYARGTKVTIEVDETRFQGGSAYLFARAIEQFLARLAGINSFVEVELISSGKGKASVHAGTPIWDARSIR